MIQIGIPESWILEASDRYYMQQIIIDLKSSNLVNNQASPFEKVSLDQAKWTNLRRNKYVDL